MMPQLVNLFGDLPEGLAAALSDNDRDLLLSGDATAADIQRIAGENPEYMGSFTAIISAVGGAIAAAAKGIGSSVSKSKTQKAKRKAAQRAAAAVLMEQQKRQKMIRTMVYFGIPAAAVGVFFLLRK